LPEHVRKERDLADVQSKLREALLHDPSQRTANQRLGTIALGQGRAAEARDYLLTAAEAEPDNPTAWRLLAESYLALGEREEACRIEAKAVAGGWAGPWRFGGRLCS
jgi:predicted Zn-dependent protease